MGRAGRWVRENRLRLAFGIALVETVAVLTDTIGWFWVLGIAALVLVAWVAARRYTRSTLVRQATTTLALSQVIPLLAPLVVGTLLALLATAVAIAVLVLLVVAVIAVAAFVRRRR